MSANRMHVTQSELKDRFVYDPETGLFRFREQCQWRKPGHVVGSLNNGYVRIRVFGKVYLAHRLAFLYMTGVPPDPFLQIDHIDGNRSNNRFSNLRVTTCRGNGQNRVEHRNIGKFPGASFHKASGKWSSHFMTGGKIYHLGLWSTKEEAYAAYSAVCETGDPVSFRNEKGIRTNAPKS